MDVEIPTVGITSYLLLMHGILHRPYVIKIRKKGDAKNTVHRRLIRYISLKNTIFHNICGGFLIMSGLSMIV
jgi:hypothetical protein